MRDTKSLAEKSRSFIRHLKSLPHKGALSHGVACHVEDPTFEITHGDVIHPCVRYIEDGFEGYQWWMVYTPLYNWDSKHENPRLCYSDAPQGQAPTEWKYYCTVIECPLEGGYNSDPSLLVKDGKLYVFWRECHTSRVCKSGYKFATYGCVVQNKTVQYLETPFLYNSLRHEDCEMSPTFFERDEKLYAYCTHLRFDLKAILYLPDKLQKLIRKWINFTTAYGIYHCNLSRGMAIWEGDSFDTAFNYIKTVKFKGKGWHYHPWHMDFFFANHNTDKHLYSIIQTNQKFADICLAWSDDGEEFQLFRFPLFTEHSIKGLYKPTAQVVDGIFHMYYTAKDKLNPSVNQLYLVSENWECLLKRMRDE